MKYILFSSLLTIGNLIVNKSILDAEGDFPKVEYPIPKHSLQSQLFRFYKRGLLTEKAYCGLWQDEKESINQKQVLLTLATEQTERMKLRKIIKQGLGGVSANES